MNTKEWTIMIYMAGDNNLSVDMAYALEQIKSVAVEGEDSPNLFVYYDGNSPEIPTLCCDFSEPQKPRYVRSYMVPDKLYGVPQKPNENTADIRSVYNFVDWCLNKVEVETDGDITYGRRAQKYAMIFSGHSLGFQDKGLFRDEGSDKSMKINDLYYGIQRLTNNKNSLKKITKEYQLEGEDRKREMTPLVGQKLDILGFDSCVMGMLEVGYQFNDVAKTMIASEGSVPNAGWTYAKILGCLTRGKDQNSTEKIVGNFVRDFIRSQDFYTIGGVSVDMAAWDLSRFHGLATAFDNLAATLTYCFNDKETIIYGQMKRIILQVHWKCQSYMYDQNVDLGDFCELLDRECQQVADELDWDNVTADLNLVQKQCREVLKELREAVILSGFSGGTYQYSNGISIFFPWSREGYEVSRKNYKSLWISKEAYNKKYPWAIFLEKYLNEVALRKFEPPTPPDSAAGSKHRYFSGIRFNENFSFTSFETTMTKIAGQEGSKIAGQEGSKLAGQEGSKLAGQEGSKIAGQEGSKIAGQEGSKIAGQEGSKLAGGSSSDAFFGSLRMFKNTESRWNISGFTKKLEEIEPETTNDNR
ncbi:hypothetical protein BH20ACI4_BH20ACI4_24740 [soil metagenome]